MQLQYLHSELASEIRLSSVYWLWDLEFSNKDLKILKLLHQIYVKLFIFDNLCYLMPK